jgi:hypothetical protein
VGVLQGDTLALYLFDLRNATNDQNHGITLRSAK